MAEIIAEKIPQKPDEKFLGAFSDTRREGYKYAPEEIPGWQTTPTIEAPIAPRPWQPKDKNKFEQEVFKQIGVNPIQIDPVKELQKIESQLPGLFNQFFKGRVIWQDRNKLSKKQADDWSDFVKSARARVFDIVASFKQQKTDEYNWLMDRFKRDEDISKEAHDAKMKQYIDKKSDWEKAQKSTKEKAPDKMKAVSQTTGKLTWHEYKNGEWVDSGLEAKPETQVSIDLNKRTQGDLQAQIIEGTDTLYKLKQAEELFQDSYLEYGGKGLAWIQQKASKLGIRDPKSYLAEYSKWKTIVDTHTLLWRKFITGVAGGEKEMEIIEKSTINTKWDDPIMFRNKLAQIKEITKAAINRATYFLKQGVDISKLTQEERDKLSSANPLESFGYVAPGDKADFEYIPGKGLVPIKKE